MTMLVLRWDTNTRFAWLARLARQGKNPGLIPNYTEDKEVVFPLHSAVDLIVSYDIRIQVCDQTRCDLVKIENAHTDLLMNLWVVKIDNITEIAGDKTCKHVAVSALAPFSVKTPYSFV